MEIRPKIRLFVDNPLQDGGTVVLAEPQAHYLLNVMRAKTGSALRLFNGVDGEWHAEITATAKRSATLSLIKRLQPQTNAPDFWLLFAPVKRARIDFIVEKATELGVSQLLPVNTVHTVIERINQDRLIAIAIEAAEQSGRLDLPIVQTARSLPAVLADWPADRRLFHLDETGGGQPIAEVLRRAPPGPVAFLVGPEGGFAKSELDALRRLSFASGVGLGARILRADTAVIAALACYQAICGDWQHLPQPQV